MRSVRPSALAGSWYPADPGPLADSVDGWLAGAPAPEAGCVPVAAVAPHAGHAYCGQVAGAVLGRLDPVRTRRVVVLGPSHYLPMLGWALPSCEAFSTPLGEVPLDRTLVHALADRPQGGVEDRAHTPEHSIEILLPFLQRRLHDFALVPVVTGELDAEGTADLAQVLAGLPGVSDGSTALVASSDFTHHGARFGYEPLAGLPPERFREALHDLDLGLADAVLHLNLPRYEAYRRRTGITACGHRPMAAVMGALARLEPDVRGHLVAYATSGDRTGDWDPCVSYAGLAFDLLNVAHGAGVDEPVGLPARAQDPDTADLTAQEGAALVKLARWAIRHWVTTGERPQAMPPGFKPTARMREPRGVFVTLRTGEALRGCIGHVEPVLPLAEAVVENAVSAACRDPRFPPLAPQEEPAVHLHLSVLSPLERIGGEANVVPGVHGIQLSLQGARGVLLPEVATDYGLSSGEFLDALCRKAGLPQGAWRHPGCHLWRFTTQGFGEEGGQG